MSSSDNIKAEEGQAFLATVDLRARSMAALVEERSYQAQRWGDEHDKRHTPEEWVSILTIYMGKLAGCTPMNQKGAYDQEAVKKRLIQVGAIAMAAWEAISAAPPTDKG